MMIASIRKLSDVDLLGEAKRLAREERELLTQVLWHLSEIFRRKAFSPRYQSISEYAMQELGYSEDQAWRRISAMKLLVELPEIEPEIASGALNLSTLNLAQTHFRLENKTTSTIVGREAKIATLRSLENKSARDATRTLISFASEPVLARLALTKPETVRPVSATMNEVRVLVSDDVLEKISRLKGLLAHKYPTLSTSELLEITIDTTLHKLNPGCETVQAASRSSRSKNVKRSADTLKTCEVKKTSATQKISIGVKTATSRLAKVARTKRTIPAVLRRKIWREAGGRCELCKSSFKLEIDHRRPFAKGGATDRKNLRLLCRVCNQRRAIQEFGLRTRLGPPGS